MLAGHSQCADYALGFVLVGKDGVPDRFRRLCFTPPCVIYNHAGDTLITTNRMFDIK